MKTFAFIFARGGSKGVIGKNIRNLGGKPLLAHSIITAQNIDEISRIFVSTDDQDIAEVGIKYGAEIINRPVELAQDDSPEWLSWLHAIKWLETRNEFFDCFPISHEPLVSSGTQKSGANRVSLRNESPPTRRHA